jgi:hypothetical protein
MNLVVLFFLFLRYHSMALRKVWIQEFEQDHGLRGECTQISLPENEDANVDDLKRVIITQSVLQIRSAVVAIRTEIAGDNVPPIRAVKDLLKKCGTYDKPIVVVLPEIEGNMR